MPQLPSGTVTFLLTDIEGSTRMWEAEPDAMRGALAVHDDAIARVISANHGLLVKSRGEGDSSFAVFDRPLDAVLAAADIQLDLGDTRWPTSTPIRVRIAVHTGEVELRDDDYFGRTVNRCARLREVGHGGQVLLSGTTHQLAPVSAPSPLGYLALGPQRLKDLERPITVYQLLHPDLPSTFPPLRSLSTRTVELPVQTTSFVGREREAQDLADLLASNRLVSVVGTGGSGKTRLAIQVAGSMSDVFRDGVWFIDLAVLEDERSVARAVASVLGVREHPLGGFNEALVSRLQSEVALLLLDNCEHVIDEAATVVEFLLSRCVSLKILVTSRELLAVPGEQTYSLRPLDLPATRASDPAEIAGSDAVRLFVERSQASLPSFALNQANAQDVAALCRHLDGLPLAIELVSPQVRSVSPAAIVEHLRRQSRLLRAKRRTIVRRHRTLESAIDWSYDRLSPGEQNLFARLAVLVGSFDTDAATAVADRGGSSDRDVSELLAQLVEKSLVNVDVAEDRRSRYRYLETMRQYARERLDDRALARACEARHADHFLSVAEAGKDLLRGPQQAEWLDRFGLDHSNMLAALHRAASRADVSYGLRLCVALWWFWRVRGYFGEGRRHLEVFLGMDSAQQPVELRQAALVAAGGLAFLQDDLDVARARYEEALELARERGDEPAVSVVLNNLGLVARVQDDHETARRLMEEALARRQKSGEIEESGAVLLNLGLIAYAQGDYSAAERYFEQGHDIAQRFDLEPLRCTILHNQASLALDLGSLDLAHRQYEESLSIARRLKHREGTVSALRGMCAVRCLRGDPDRADEDVREALELAQDMGSRWDIAACEYELGEGAFSRGDLPPALAHYEASLGIRRELGHKQGVVRSLCGCGLVALLDGDLSRARASFDESLAIAREINDRRGVADASDWLGLLDLRTGALSGARQGFAEGLRIRSQLGHKARAIWSLEHFAALALASGDPATCLRLQAAADRQREALGVPRPPVARADYRRRTEAARAQLTPADADAAWDAGAALDLSAAIQHALEPAPSPG